MRQLKTVKVTFRLALQAVLAGSVVALLALLPGCGRKAGVAVIVAGSTSVQPFAEILAEDFMKLHPEVTVDVQGGGSAAGILAASSGTADVGMSSRALSGDELKLWNVEIARDGLALIVNPHNQITGLTIAQARDIYSGAISRWSAVGGSGARIHVVAREDGSGTRSAFESLVMGKDSSIAASSIVQDSNGAVRQLVSSDPDAIGFISLGLVDQTVKALKLDGVEASKDDVLKGTYRLSRPFIFMSRHPPDGRVKAFVDFVMSDAGRKILNSEGLVTVDGSASQ